MRGYHIRAEGGLSDSFSFHRHAKLCLRMEDFDRGPYMKDVRVALRGEGIGRKADMILKLSVVREDVWI